MNDELKEILDYLDLYKNLEEGLLPSRKKKILLNYITNLQQENEELKKNQRYYKNGVFSLEYDKETMSDMIDDYKSRIEKAVEYIDRRDIEWGSEQHEYLLNILNGRSDE